VTATTVLALVPPDAETPAPPAAAIAERDHCPAVLPGEHDLLWDPSDDPASRFVARAELRCCRSPRHEVTTRTHPRA